MSRRIGQIIPRGRRTRLVRVFLGRDHESGKRRYHNETIRGAVKDAHAYLRRMLEERDRVSGQSKMRVNEYLDHWLEIAARPKLCVKSYRHYEGLLRRYVRPQLGERLLASVAPLDIQGVYQRMLERGLSVTMIRYLHAVVHSASKQGIRWRLLSNNPAEGVELPRCGRREMQVLTVDQARIFL